MKSSRESRSYSYPFNGNYSGKELSFRCRECGDIHESDPFYRTVYDEEGDIMFVDESYKVCQKCANYHNKVRGMITGFLFLIAFIFFMTTK